LEKKKKSLSNEPVYVVVTSFGPGKLRWLFTRIGVEAKIGIYALFVPVSALTKI
jgi:hypothetical protein